MPECSHGNAGREVEIFLVVGIINVTAFAVQGSPIVEEEGEEDIF